MASTLTRRLFTFSKSINQIFNINPHILQAGLPPDPGDHGVFRRFFHGGPGFENPTSPGGSFTVGPESRLREKLASIGGIQLHGLKPPPATNELELSVEDTKKLLRLAAVVKLKKKLMEIAKSSITYHEYVKICRESCSDSSHGLELAKILDETGAVIVLGSVVFLRPDEIAKEVAGIIAMEGVSRRDDVKWRELEEMEREKREIDRRADKEVRKELWWGLSLMVVQTGGLMRLTFWDLTWDVMEPICYYVTSAYFMAAYAFFITTLKEPSFEALYHTRFQANQKRLIKLHNFDFEKYTRLREDFHKKRPFI